MKFEIDKSQIPSDHLTFLSNFEMELTVYIRTIVVGEISDLGVKPSITIVKRSDKFYKLESNAGFEINNSLLINDKINSYLKAKLHVDYPECSIIFRMTYRNLPPETKNNEKKQAESKGNDDGLPTFLPQEPRYSFEQIILPSDTKERILNDLNTIKCQDLIYNQWGFAEVDPKPKSILNFFGPPGTGKTMCAHAIAKMLGKPLLALNYSEIESKYVGDAAKNLKKAFDTAKEINAVMFFDEADSFLGKRI